MISLKNFKIILLALIISGMQACGNASINEGFTETDISTPDLAPGIQEGLCEETEKFSSDTKSPCRAKLHQSLSVGLSKDPVRGTALVN